MSIGERIKERRIELGMTQAELANRIGTTYQAISKYENDIVDTIPTKKLQLIAFELGVSPMYLLGMSDDKESVSVMPDLIDKLKDNPNLRVLLSSSAKLSPEDLQAVIMIVRSMSRD